MSRYTGIFKCDRCDEAYNRFEDLAMHRRAEHDIPFERTISEMKAGA